MTYEEIGKLERELTKSKYHPQLEFRLAVLYMRVGDYEKCMPLIDKTLTADAETPFLGAIDRSALEKTLGELRSEDKVVAAIRDHYAAIKR